MSFYPSSQRFSLSRPLISIEGPQTLGGPSLPGFPEVKLHWHGTHIESLRSVGIHRSFHTQVIDWRSQLIEFHEVSHAALQETLPSRLIRLNSYKLWNEIILLCEGKYVDGFDEDGRPVIRNVTQPLNIPLLPSAYSDGLRLQRFWKNAYDLNERSNIVQEIVAVWLSLYVVKQKKLITNKRRLYLEGEYKSRYESEWGLLDFKRLYDKFKRIADKIGLEALKIAFLSLSTFSEEPKSVFERVIEQYLLHLNRRELNANQLFDKLHGDFTKENNERLRVTRSSIMEPYCNISEVAILTTGENIPGLKLQFSDWLLRWICGPLDAFRFTYDERGLDFGGRGIEARLLFAESVRQQLTTGEGLVCPFWSEGRDICCQVAPEWKSYRPLLEGILKHTRHELGQSEWQGRGCLRS